MIDGLQDGPRRPFEAPRRTQREPQEGPKRAPRRPQRAPRGPQDPPKSLKRAPRCPKRAPRGPQDPRKSPIAPRRPPVLQDSLQDSSTPSSPSSPCPLCFTICVSSFHFPSALMGRASEWAGGDSRSVNNMFFVFRCVWYSGHKEGPGTLPRSLPSAAAQCF